MGQELGADDAAEAEEDGEEEREYGKTEGDVAVFDGPLARRCGSGW